MSKNKYKKIDLNVDQVDEHEDEVEDVVEEVVEDRSAFNCPQCGGEGIYNDQRCSQCLGTGKV